MWSPVAGPRGVEVTLFGDFAQKLCRFPSFFTMALFLRILTVFCPRDGDSMDEDVTAVDKENLLAR
jgi:hypothetical protein